MTRTQRTTTEYQIIKGILALEKYLGCHCWSPFKILIGWLSWFSSHWQHKTGMLLIRDELRCDQILFWTSLPGICPLTEPIISTQGIHCPLRMWMCTKHVGRGLYMLMSRCQVHKLDQQPLKLVCCIFIYFPRGFFLCTIGYILMKCCTIYFSCVGSTLCALYAEKWSLAPELLESDEHRAIYELDVYLIIHFIFLVSAGGVVLCTVGDNVDYFWTWGHCLYIY